MNQNNHETPKQAVNDKPENEIDYLRKRLTNMANQKKGWHDVLTILIPLLIALVTVLASFYQSDQASRLKFQELRLKERQIVDALDPKIIEALLNDKTKKNAIALGNGIYIYNRGYNSAEWWCGVIKEIEPNNPPCLEFYQ